MGRWGEFISSQNSESAFHLCLGAPLIAAEGHLVNYTRDAFKRTVQIQLRHNEDLAWFLGVAIKKISEFSLATCYFCHCFLVGVSHSQIFGFQRSSALGKTGATEYSEGVALWKISFSLCSLHSCHFWSLLKFSRRSPLHAFILRPLSDKLDLAQCVKVTLLQWRRD